VCVCVGDVHCVSLSMYQGSEERGPMWKKLAVARRMLSAQGKVSTLGSSEAKVEMTSMVAASPLKAVTEDSVKPEVDDDTDLLVVEDSDEE
jgi:hypothetical protein